MTLYVSSHTVQPDGRFPMPAPDPLNSRWRMQGLSTATQMLRRGWRFLLGREAIAPGGAGRSHGRHRRHCTPHATPLGARPRRGEGGVRAAQRSATGSASPARAMGPMATGIQDDHRLAEDATPDSLGVGRAGCPTLAQEWRGRGGRW